MSATADAALARSTLTYRASRNMKERGIELLLLAAASISVLATVGIMIVLISESLSFFKDVSLWRFLTDTQWTPLFENPQFGIFVLLSGTLTSSLVALLIAIPLGTVIAVYLSEFAGFRTREIAKPILELLGGVPTVVYGFFAMLVITPLLQKIMPNLPGYNLLSAGLAMGLMIIPYVSSLAEDAMRAVPMHMREGSYAMGATKLQTAWRVVMPGAASGIGAAYILAISRAVGETMIVAVAGGMQPNLTINPMQEGLTVTSYIVQVAKGDLEHGSVGYQSIFAAGLALMLVTLLFNLLGAWLRRKFRETY